MAELLANTKAHTAYIRRFVDVVEMWECEWKAKRIVIRHKARRPMVQQLVQSQCLHEDIILFSFVLALTPVSSDHHIVWFSRALLDPIFYQTNDDIYCKRRLDACNGPSV